MLSRFSTLRAILTLNIHPMHLGSLRNIDGSAGRGRNSRRGKDGVKEALSGLNILTQQGSVKGVASPTHASVDYYPFFFLFLPWLSLVISFPMPMDSNVEWYAGKWETSLFSCPSY